MGGGAVARIAVCSPAVQDVLITDVLVSLGLASPDAQAAGLTALYEAELTRPGKSRIAEPKVPLAEEAVRAAVFRACHKPACGEKAQRDGRATVQVAVEHCDGCSGGDNRTAVAEMLDAMRRTGRTKLLVVGGAPNSRNELESLCAGQCGLRFLTAEQNPGRRTSDEQVAWADVAVIWGSTQIPHKMTVAIRGPHVITCGQRGIAALARSVTQHLGG